MVFAQRQKLGKVDEMIKLSQRERLLSDEKVRRQGQLLEEATQRANIAQKENRTLIVKLNKLQKWTERLDDEEVQQHMRQLYHSLESWVKNNFLHLLTSNLKARSSESVQDTCSPDNGFPLDHSYIQGEVSFYIFNHILSRFVVGIDEQRVDGYLSYLDLEIEKLC